MILNPFSSQNNINNRELIKQTIKSGTSLSFNHYLDNNTKLAIITCYEVSGNSSGPSYNRMYLDCEYLDTLSFKNSTYIELDNYALPYTNYYYKSSPRYLKFYRPNGYNQKIIIEEYK